jgi:hypothetical protein
VQNGPVTSSTIPALIDPASSRHEEKDGRFSTGGKRRT